MYQPGDVHKTGGMYFLTSQNEKNVCVCKEPLCYDPIPSPSNVVSVVYVLFESPKETVSQGFGCFVTVSKKILIARFTLAVFLMEKHT